MWHRSPTRCSLPLVWLSVAILVLFGGVQVCATTATQGGTVFFDPGTAVYTFQGGVVDKERGAAWGVWTDSLQQVGWSTLQVVGSSRVQDDVMAYAAGFLEGHFTARHMAAHWENLLHTLFPNQTDVPAPVLQFYRENDEWARQQVQQHSSSDPYWRQVGLVLQQYRGLLDGYNQAAQSQNLQTFSLEQLALLAAAGDIFDVATALQSAAERPQFSKMNREEILRYMMEHNHCSALIKVLPDLSDFYMGHTTWVFYTFMTRIFKHIYLPFQEPSTMAKQVSFSSYPGALASIDDFYVTSAGLVVSETTNSILNETLYDLVTPRGGLMTWLRTVVTNRMSSSGKEWTAIFARENSGTYNCQWMILDQKLFAPGQPLSENLLWILEQIPGYVASGDETLTLNSGYWPSYNVPYFRTVFEKSGYPAMEKKHGSEFSYDNCPRAQIYRDRTHTVTNMESMRMFMRYNDWEVDPLSHMNPCNAVASRCDLSVDPSQRSYMGGIDSKLTSFSLVPNQVIHAISGPTSVQQPVFAFTGEWASVFHKGVPERFDFDWQLMAPSDTIMEEE